MKANIITIDPSIICTALVVNDKKFAYVGEHIAKTKKGQLTSWFEKFSDLVEYRVFDTKNNDSLPYSDAQLVKMAKYTIIVKHIIDDIQNNIDVNINSVIGIEGYSYSSAAGPLIDLVTFSTLLRSALIHAGFHNITIMAPSELKNKICHLAYPNNIIKDKCRSDCGIAGGKFNKSDMLRALIKLPSVVGDPWVERIIDNLDSILEKKEIPKPLEDINDAKIMYEWLKHNI